MIFDEVDTAMDRLDHRYPRCNLPYSNEEKVAIREAIDPLREKVLTIWKDWMEQHRQNKRDESFGNQRDEALRVLTDIDRLRLDLELTPL